ncbi:MAG TPA: N-acetylmuramoyl-L-alanine amidase [Solirubrobacterales bacterium]|nr:N-acetylmuramoyl-L-alanine amidase [Solirubrobacterales bacterium]
MGSGKAGAEILGIAALVLAAAIGAGSMVASAGQADRASRGDRVPAIRGSGAGGELAGLVVTIDPGHNGENGSHPEQINEQVPIGNGETKACDTAGTETASGYTESAYNLDVALRLKRLLRKAGAKVVLTRDNDHGVGPCIDERAKIGNDAGSDAAISIHADGGPPGGRGFHVIYPTRIEGLTDDIYADSRRLAVVLRNAYEHVTGLPRSTYAGEAGLDRRSDLGGLRLSDVPKVFIETGNMRNHTDAQKLESNGFRRKIARGIFAGLRRFLLE